MESSEKKINFIDWIKSKIEYIKEIKQDKKYDKSLNKMSKYYLKNAPRALARRHKRYIITVMQLTDQHDKMTKDQIKNWLDTAKNDLTVLQEYLDELEKIFIKYDMISNTKEEMNNDN